MRRCHTSLLPLTTLALGLALVGPASAAPAGPAASAAAQPVVKGAILDRYRALGGARSFLGLPLTSERPTPNRPGAFNLFQGGSIYWAPGVGAWEVHGAIRDDWGSLGYEDSGLGFPTSNEISLSGGAAYNAFQNGLCYYAPGLGAHEVRGAIRDAYDRLGREKGRLGFPTSNEQGTPDGTGRYSVFRGGYVYWSPGSGANEVEGLILAKWASLGYERSPLGYPVRDEYAVPGGRASDFQGGTITWTPATGAVVTTSGGPVTEVGVDTFAIASLEQSFRYDANDQYAQIVVSPDGTEGAPVMITQAQFTAQLAVGSLVAFGDYAAATAHVSTFVLVTGVPPGDGTQRPAVTRARVEKALQSARR